MRNSILLCRFGALFAGAGAMSAESVSELGVTPITPLGNAKSLRTSDPWTTPLVNGCPKLCDVVGSNPTNWTHIHDQADLSKCDQPLLFDLNVQNAYARYTTIRTCALTQGGSMEKRRAMPLAKKEDQSPVDATDLDAVEEFIASSDSCGATKADIQTSASVGPATLKKGDDAAAALQLLASYVADKASCGKTLLFAKSGESVVGLYSGADVQNSAASNIINQFR